MNVAEVDGILYAIGGTIEWPGPSVNGVYAYDPATNTWSTRAPTPLPIAVSGTGVVNGKIYIIGGLSGSQAVNTVLEYEPSSDTWTDLTSVSPLPTPRDHFMAGVIDGKIYCPGGRQVALDALVDVHEVFDPATRNWTTAARMPTPRAGFIGVTLGPEFLAIGGEGADNTLGVFSQNEAYNPLTDTWRTLSPMTTPRHGTQGGVINNIVYIPAGSPVIGRTFTDTHEAFSLNF
jgi:N-acetylneuraminic acid mutarotase